MVRAMSPLVGMRRPHWVRVLAGVFVFAILADLAFDGSCDRISAATASGASLAPFATGSPDACVNGCVPDCFCCAPAVTHGLSVLPPDSGPATSAGLLPLDAAPVGVHPVPYHPPLQVG
jgi:hypothetical protein